jgi:hypothetical protein
MKLCTNCLRELFNTDNVCDECGSEQLIDDNEIKDIKQTLAKVGNRKRQTLIQQDKKMYCVYEYMLRKNGDRYWRDVDSKCVSHNVVTPTQPTQSRPSLQCPYCHSTHVRKIGTVGRMVSVGLFGLASKKIGKQWHCNDCGSDF